MEFTKAKIRLELLSLVNRRQKLHDMGYNRLSMREAIAIRKIRQELGFRIHQNFQSHYEMVLLIKNQIETLMPSIRSRYFNFREELKDMIKFCEREELQELYK